VVFVRRIVAFVWKIEIFLRKNVPFLPGDELILVRNDSFFPGDESILRRIDLFSGQTLCASGGISYSSGGSVYFYRGMERLSGEIIIYQSAGIVFPGEY
jgi:hypothetical protein